MSEEIKYPFGIDYQTKILAVIARDREFTLRYRDLLQYNYFDSNVYVDTCKIILQFVDEYNTLPSQETILNKVRERENKGLIERLVQTIYTLDLSDSADTVKEIVNFVQQQQWRLTQPQISEAVKNCDFEKAKLLFDKNMRIEEKSLHEKDEIFYFQNIQQSLLALDPDKVRAKRVATLIHPIDRALGGGAENGTLNILFAPRKMGKSIFLINVCVAALYQQKNVLFVSLELGAEQIEERIHTRITGISSKHLYDERYVASGRIKRLRSLQGHLVIKKYPTMGASVNTIRNYIEYLWQVKGFRVDILLLDYIDILAPVDKHALRWQSQGPNSEFLRGIADIYNIPVWTVTQGNALTEKKEASEGTDMKGDTVKAETADSVFSLLQSPEEAEVDKARLYVNYLRNGAGMHGVHNMRFVKEKMLLTELKE